MNFSTVCMRFVNDVSGDVCEYDEWVIFGKVHDIQDGRCDGEVVWVQCL